MTPDEMREIVDVLPYNTDPWCHQRLLLALIDHVERLDAAQPPTAQAREHAQEFRSCMRSIAAALDIDAALLSHVDPIAAVDDVIVPAIQANTAKLDELSLKLAEAESKTRAAEELIADKTGQLNSSAQAFSEARRDLQRERSRRVELVEAVKRIAEHAEGVL